MTRRTLLGIVFHSGLSELEACLKSVAPESVAGGGDTQVVVLDSSPEGAARDVVDSFGMVWMDGARNAGYAWALHEIARGWLRDDDVFVASNADVVYRPDSLARLARNAAELNAVCYPLQVDDTGAGAYYNVAHQLTGRSLFAQWLGVGRRRMRRGNMRVTLSAERAGAPVPIPPGKYGSGAVIAMPASLWIDTGGLDRRFFLFSEDKSYGSTLESHGVKAYLCGDAPVVHLGGTISQGVRVEPVVESLVSEQLNWDKLYQRGSTVVLVTQCVAMLIRYAFSKATRRESNARAYAAALAFRLRHLRAVDAAAVGADGYRVAAYRGRDGTQNTVSHAPGTSGRDQR